MAEAWDRGHGLVAMSLPMTVEMEERTVGERGTSKRRGRESGFDRYCRIRRGWHHGNWVRGVGTWERANLNFL